MKKLILLAGVATLAACGGNKDDVATDDNAMADNTVVVDETPTTASYVGSFAVSDAAGADLGTTVTSADGTYVDNNPDGSTMSGTWRTSDDGKLCFDQDGDDPEKCWTAGDVVDGKTTWTADDGEVVMAVLTPAG